MNANRLHLDAPATVRLSGARHRHRSAASLSRRTARGTGHRAGSAGSDPKTAADRVSTHAPPRTGDLCTSPAGRPSSIRSTTTGRNYPGRRSLSRSAGQRVAQTWTALLPVAKSIYGSPDTGRPGPGERAAAAHPKIVDDIPSRTCTRTRSTDPAITFFTDGFQQPGRRAWRLAQLWLARQQQLPSFVVLLSQARRSCRPRCSRGCGGGSCPRVRASVPAAGRAGAVSHDRRRARPRGARCSTRSAR